MIIYNNKNCQIDFIKEQGTLIQHWNGFACTDTFRSALIFTAKTFEKEDSLHYLLSDTFKQKAAKPEDIEWAAREINPRLFKAGLEKMAFILPESRITKISIDGFQHKNNSPFKITYCNTVSEALNWIS